MELLSVYKLVEPSMQEFKQRYQSIMVLHADKRLQPFLSEIEARSGKQLRPLITLLAAASNGGITADTYRSAMMVEMMHVSSIIHDDVIDNGVLRRGNPSVNASYGNQIAVLLGDYILAQCMETIASNAYLVQLSARVARKMAEGELLQLKHKWNITMEENDYFEIIQYKTALLFSACFEAGAQSANAGSSADVRQWAKAGMDFGILFQMCDDMSDYFSHRQKKDNYKDILEHKITFPLLSALQHCSSARQEELLHLYMHHQGTQEEVQAICSLVTAYGGLDYTMQAVLRFRQQVEDFLSQCTPSVYITALQGIMDYVIQTVKQ